MTEVDVNEVTVANDGVFDSEINVTAPADTEVSVSGNKTISGALEEGGLVDIESTDMLDAEDDYGLEIDYDYECVAKAGTGILANVNASEDVVEV